MNRYPCGGRPFMTARLRLPTVPPRRTPAEPPGREERGWSGSLRPFIGNVLFAPANWLSPASARRNPRSRASDFRMRSNSGLVSNERKLADGGQPELLRAVADQPWSLRRGFSEAPGGVHGRLRCTSVLRGTRHVRHAVWPKSADTRQRIGEQVKMPSSCRFSAWLVVSGEDSFCSDAVASGIYLQRACR